MADDTTASSGRGLPATSVDGTGSTVALLHGFSQTHRSWGPLLPHLAGRRLVLPDLPGHGSAGHDGADLARSAHLVAEKVGRAVYVGYSMGGRVALRLALDHPEDVASLVLISATAGIDDPDARADRRQADGALADRIERDGTCAFLERWLAQPLFAGLEVDAEDLSERQANRPDGLAASLRHAGTGTMDPPWWHELDRIACPTLVLAGGEDHKFVAIGRRLADGIGANANLSVVAGAGHAAHLERPAAVAATIAAFLD